MTLWFWPSIRASLGPTLLGSTVLVGDLPVRQAQHGRSGKVRAELDLHGFRTVLSAQPVAHCFIERVAARPGQGTVSMFRFGEAAGAVYDRLVGLNLPVTFVTPQQWQKHHGIGASPDAARQRVPLLSRKRDQHRADALLLACYGRHHLGAEVSA